MKQILVILYVLLGCCINSKADSISVAEGKKIFLTRCAACHSINFVVVGPALMNVSLRRTEPWIISFVHGSQAMIQHGDTAANKLFNKFNKTIMPDQADLTALNIKSIIGYIKSQTIAPVLAASALASANVEDNDPYINKTGFFHRLVFFNISGSYLPISFQDYKTWIVIALLISFLVIALYVKVRAESFITFLNKKFK